MYLGIPQVIYLILLMMGLGHSLVKDGQPKEGNHSFGWSLTSTIIILLILFSGGFFSR
jgi:hypothetical protein